MKPVYCPICKRLLFKAEIANIEIKCGSCKRLVKVQFYTQKGLLLTPSSKEDTIEIVDDLQKDSKPSK
jgi:phage FluMu protein Com